MKIKYVVFGLLPLSLMLVAYFGGDDAGPVTSDTTKEQDGSVAGTLREIQGSAADKMDLMSAAVVDVKESVTQKVDDVATDTTAMVQEKATEMMDKGTAMAHETKIAVVEKSAELATTAAAAVVAKADAIISQDAMIALAKKSGCFACHAIDKKVMGPSWNLVAEKYSDDSASRALLINSIAHGSKGTWGAMAMPANSPRVADADIEKLSDFILSLK